ncbi:hypothetical protein ACQ4PT_001463 [Festuca glaucescens]
MANFPVRPWPFLEGPDDIEVGHEDRLQRNMIVVDDPPLLHEEYALVFINPQVPDHQRQYFLDKICRVLREDYNYEVSNPEIHLCCVGLIAFEDAVIRYRMIRDSPHALDDDYTFSLVKHDEGPDMRQPVCEYEAWVMMLSFPLDYQTNHYVNKAVYLFGKLLIWHRPRVKKSRVLVKVFINEVALVPRSLVVKRISVLGGNWSFLQQVDLAWMDNAQAGNEEGNVQGNGWGVWPEVPQPFVGYNFRNLFQYEGPSMMDGVIDINNVSDDPLEAWNEYAEVEAAADRIEHGIVGLGLRFVRAGGELHDMMVPEIDTFLAFVGRMIRSVYTRRIMPENHAHVVSFIPAYDLSEMLRALFDSLGRRALLAVLRGPNLDFLELSDSSVRAPHSVMITKILDDAPALPVSDFSATVVEDNDVDLGLVLGDGNSDMFDPYEVEELILPISHVSLVLPQVLEGSSSGVFHGSAVLPPVPPPEPPAPVLDAPAPVAALGCGHRRGRRQPTPSSVVAVRCSPCLHNAGYVHDECPESSRATSFVAKADVLAVLQIKELQRIGVEHCHTPLEDLSEDRLLQEPED